jgi:hypothetical protein
VDAEVLAAWAEGRLPRREANLVETHLATCAHCQEVVAVFARTADALPDPREAPAAGRLRWRWVIPAAAAATAAAIWLATPERTVDEFERTVAPAIQESPSPPATSGDAATPAEAASPSASPRRDAPALQDRAEKRAAQANERDEDLESEVREGDADRPVAPQSAAAASEVPAGPEQARSRAQTALLRAASNEVASPDPLVRWRISPPAQLERTTNGGKTWEAIEVRESVGLVSVSAPTATTAIVTTGDGRQFRTDDQGKTWNLVE